MNKVEKKELVNILKDKIRSNNFILSGFKGLSVAEIEEMRNKLRDLNYSSNVTKNRLLAIALKELDVEGFAKYLIDTTILTIQNEQNQLNGFKVLTDFAKSSEKFFIKAGYIDGRVLNSNEVEKIANLPSREVLLAKLLAQLNATISKFIYTINNPIVKLVYVLDAVKNKKKIEIK
ncbi:MAG: 50S ribosomal protein L10 [Endomicrobium sp.]|jgi:large subunit ribosomal protein L10|nr:50S ribosomal protein L10 [Endomicrobium sp.]